MKIPMIPLESLLITSLQVLRGSADSARILVFVAMRKQCDIVVRCLRKHAVPLVTYGKTSKILQKSQEKEMKRGETICVREDNMGKLSIKLRSKEKHLQLEAFWEAPELMALLGHRRLRGLCMGQGVKKNEMVRLK